MTPTWVQIPVTRYFNQLTSTIIGNALVICIWQYRVNTRSWLDNPSIKLTGGLSRAAASPRGGELASSTTTIHFRTLYEALGRGLVDEGGTLLLYSLLHGCDAFQVRSMELCLCRCRLWVSHSGCEPAQGVAGKGSPEGCSPLQASPALDSALCSRVDKYARQWRKTKCVLPLPLFDKATIFIFGTRTYCLKFNTVIALLTNLALVCKTTLQQEPQICLQPPRFRMSKHTAFDSRTRLPSRRITFCPAPTQRSCCCPYCGFCIAACQGIQAISTCCR